MKLFLIAIILVFETGFALIFEESGQHRDYFDILDASHGFGKAGSAVHRHHAAGSNHRHLWTNNYNHFGMAPIIDFDRAEVDDNPGDRLYAKLMRNYSVDVLPVNSTTQAVKIKMLLKLTQLLDIDEKNQIMTTNVWLRHEWYDNGLTWKPDDFGGIKTLHMPADDIWLPDTVLYNNADGDYQLTIATKVEIRYDGLVIWEPPAIYKSFCAIDVEFFPYDYQTCELKFGPWTYDVSKVDYFLVGPDGNTSDHQEDAVDMSGYYESTEWDLIHVHANRRVYQYECCQEVYLDITYLFNIRRKTLFYTVNLIIPCIMIVFLTILVFYLPCESNQKMSFTISTFLALTWFILLLSEIIPPTSLALPLMGKFLLFTTVLVTLSISISIFILNNHFRHPYCSQMPNWIRFVFLNVLPKMLCFFSEISPASIKVEAAEVTVTKSSSESRNESKRRNRATILMANSWIYKGAISPQSPIFVPVGRTRIGSSGKHMKSPVFALKRRRRKAAASNNASPRQQLIDISKVINSALPAMERYMQLAEVQDAVNCINFIAKRYEKATQEAALKDEWQAIARVLDRLFLVIFTLIGLIGTPAILLWAPSLFDRRQGLMATDSNELVDSYQHHFHDND